MPETSVLVRQKLSLNDLCSDMLVLILHLRQVKAIPDPQQLRSRVKELIAHFERDAHEVGVDEDGIGVARLALVAFVDEAVFGINFAGKEQWQENTLGMELLGINYAGAEFFTKLDEYRRRSHDRHGVLELLYLCLILGYKGKFLNDPDGLRDVVTDLKASLFRTKEGRSALTLSPRGKPERELRGLVRSEIPIWVVFVCAGALAVLFYACLTWQVNDAVNTVVSTLK